MKNIDHLLMVKEYRIMKNINKYILEKLRISKDNIKNTKKTIVANDFHHLHRIIEQEINQNGVHCSLNHIDISNIEDISYCFFNIRKFDGDISEWDVSNVKSMNSMFLKSNFTGKYGDIDGWDVSNVEDMSSMFDSSKFNGDISGWDVSNVTNMNWMFARCETFNKDISNWKINKKCAMDSMFLYSSLDEKYRPQKI